MANVFEATDPRGRRVTCTDETWDNHILTGHPIMEGQEGDVQAAIQKPTIGIFRDAHFEDREVYYLLKRRTYVKVVVRFDGDVGTVITAFETDSPKRGERMIWPVSSD